VKVATFNVNSVRPRLPLVLDWMNAHRPDVMCLQETKVQDADFPVRAFQEIGYHATYRGMKAYNGVATLSLEEPEKVVFGLHEGPDNDDYRIIQAVIQGIPIINTYVPQGYLITSEKYAFKLAWFKRLKAFFEKTLDPQRPAVWVGDVNVAPEPIDVYHPEKRMNEVDFHVDARNAYKETLAWGFVDVFRKLHPDVVQYTYWDYFRNAFERNFGWRIDHILATAPLAEKCQRVEVDMETRRQKGSSDHTIVWAEFRI
jgi:exodeoxyribonuclease-3